MGGSRRWFGSGRRMATAAVAAWVLVCGAAGVARADPSTPGVVPTGLKHVASISSDGRFVVGRAKGATGNVLLDLGTMTSTPRAHGAFVIDNPDLTVVAEMDPRAHWLVNTATGSRARIDADAVGNALVPGWSGTCGEDCYPSDYPHVLVSVDSVTRDGSTVAFCANYTTPTVFSLYVKDMVTGALVQRPEACSGPASPSEVGGHVDPPVISETGTVIHLRGARDAEDGYYWGDTLVFPRKWTARTVNGNGSMTRDGRTLFMRIGVHPAGTTDRTGGKVGAYNIVTKRTTRLPGRYTIYGSDALYTFSAFRQSTRRGRYVAYGDRPAVIDRTLGVTVDLGPIVRAHGLLPTTEELWGPYTPVISSNGSTVLVSVGEDREDSGGDQMVAVTGWHPAAIASVRAIGGASKLRVDVDPNKGRGYWRFAVERRGPEGTWRNVGGTYRTQGAKETRTINLPAGTYRVVVKPKYGYLGSTSADVVLSR